MQQQVAKLRGHVDALVDILLSLKGRWVMLHPLLFDQSVVQTYSGKNRLRGLDIVRRTFVFACVQDIANISLAPNRKTPSVHNILEGLKVRSTVDLLRDSYSATMQSVDDPDPQVVNALRNIAAQGEAQRRREFDQRLGQAEARWATLAVTRELANFKAYRDKVAAHVDVSFKDGQYVPFDAADLGLKWKDFAYVIEELQAIVLELNAIVRSADFAMEAADGMFADAARSFWRVQPAR